MEETGNTVIVVEPIKENLSPLAGCPQCHIEPRHVVKQGAAYRRAKGDTGKLAEVQMYQCTRCGYKARGNMFHMTEEMHKEKSNEAEIVVIAPVKTDVFNTA